MVVVILVFSCGVVIVGSLSARPPFGATLPRGARPPAVLLAMDPAFLLAVNKQTVNGGVRLIVASVVIHMYGVHCHANHV